MLLTDTNVLVFAATGNIGRVTARHLAQEGAHVWASGRDRDALDRLVAEIDLAGGTATPHLVDATDPAAVDRYVATVAEAAGRIDATFNAIGQRPAQLGYPAHSADLDLETFERPLRLIVSSTFLTARAAARVMTAQGHGSIVNLSASLGGSPVPFMAALTATCGAIEAMTRSLAAEYGPAGVRVNCVRGDAMPETSTIRETMAGTAALLGFEDPSDMPLPPGSTLGRPITVAETAATVAFLASDAAGGTTAQVVDVGGRAMPG